MTTIKNFDIELTPKESALRRLQRYSVNTSKIILSPNQPTGELVKDPKGDLVKLEDLVRMVSFGGLLDNTRETKETLADGVAHQQFMRRLESLGYTDFDQVLQLLTECRGQVLKLREFEVWMSGYRATGEDQKAQLLGKGVGLSFNEAVLNLKEQLGPHKTSDWSQWNGTWSSHGCTFHSDEAEARKVNG